MPFKTFLGMTTIRWVAVFTRIKRVMNECKLSEIVGELVRQERGDLAFSVAFDVRTDDPGTVISKQSFRRQTANFRRRNNCSRHSGAISTLQASRKNPFQHSLQQKPPKKMNFVQI